MMRSSTNSIGSDRNDDDSDEDGVVFTYKERYSTRRTVLKILASVAIASSFFLLGRETQRRSVEFSSPTGTQTMPTLKNTTLTSLGPACPHDNWRQAKAQGCLYDLMLSSWLHPACFQPELYAQYREWMGWRNVTFWREREMVSEVPYDEAESGEHDGFLYAQGLQHHLHCSYVWARQRYAEARTPKVLDTYCRDEAHVDHCVFFNAVPFTWEIVAPNVTKIYQPYDVECLVDSI